MRGWTGDRGITSAGVPGVATSRPEGRKLSALGLDTTALGLWHPDYHWVELGEFTSPGRHNYDGSPKASIKMHS